MPMFSSPGPYLLPFPCCWVHHRVYLSSTPPRPAVLSSPRFQGETGRHGMGKVQELTVVTHETGCTLKITPRHRLMSQTFVSTARWGRKANFNSLKKAKGKLYRFITRCSSAPWGSQFRPSKTCSNVEELQARPKMQLHV